MKPILQKFYFCKNSMLNKCKKRSVHNSLDKASYYIAGQEKGFQALRPCSRVELLLHDV